MSRRSKSSSPAVGNGKKGPPPSHPLELLPDHRAFLIRSLDRNDVELAALMELNRSLHKVKARLIETCGESTLLDLGEGRLRLSRHGDDTLEVAPPPPPPLKNGKQGVPAKLPSTQEGIEVCVEFLLRMKLRRKLLNRLARRLNRLAHAMDGEDVGPPGLPRYGDLGLHVDDSAVKEFEERWKRQEEALQRMKQRKSGTTKEEEEREEEATQAHDDKRDEKEKELPPRVPSAETDPEKASASKREAAAPDQVSDQVPSEPIDRPSEKEEADSGQATDQVPSATTDPETAPASKEKAADSVQVVDNVVSSDVLAPNKEEEVADSSPVAGQPPSRTTDAGHEVDQVTSTAPKAPHEAEAAATTIQDRDTLMREDYEALKEYDDAYEKLLNPSTGAARYAILDQEHGDEDYSLIKYGAGIGATHRSMSTSDKEIEWKRWQNALLQRVPEQPTFEELGLQHRVFNLEARRKRLAKEEQKNSKKRVKKEEEEDGQDDDDDVRMDVVDSDDEQNDEQDDDDDYEEVKADGDDSESDDPKETQQKKKDETGAVAALKLTKFISLAATPSFHEQDRKRLLLIHADLMAKAITEHARRSVQEATDMYNRSFRKANALYNEKVKLEAELNSLVARRRVAMSHRGGEAAKLDWLRRKQIHDIERAQRCMPTFWGKAPRGTPKTAEAARDHGDSVRANVAHLLQNMVDGVVTRTSDPNWKDNRFEDLFPPPDIKEPGDIIVDHSTGETLAQREKRMRADFATVMGSLQAAENDRKRAWRKMLKTKQDFDIPHQHTSTAGGRKTKIQLDPSQFHLLPLPPLGSHHGILSTPTYDTTTVPTYMPPKTPAGLKMKAAYGVNSDSKYSAARLQERVGSDGTVAPVTEPKRNSAGLYQRPAGRTRKGMDWDAVRGIWVPVSNPDAESG